MMKKMKAINVSNRAFDIIEGIRDEKIYNNIKSGIADLFAYALSDVSQWNLRSYELRGFEALADLTELINELAIKFEAEESTTK